MSLLNKNSAASKVESDNSATGRFRLRWPGSAGKPAGGTGLEAKILVALMLLLTAAMGSTCWVSATQIKSQIIDIMGEQTRQIAYALSMSTKPALSSGDATSLARIGRDLLKTRNIIFIAFYDASGKSISISDRESKASPPASVLSNVDLETLTQVKVEYSDRFGTCLRVCEPVISSSPGNGSSAKLIGYVTVGVWAAEEQAQVRRVNYFAAGIGCVMVLVTLPLAYVVVHRIFWPIRQLVTATDEIASGNLDAQVAVHRPDVIGELARAFNKMVKTVKQQRQDLQDANHLLEVANSQLEEKVLLRTQELEAANGQLTREIAEKEDFLRAVSHDLNAPLRNISGMTAMLLMKHRETFDEDVVHRLERIQKNVEMETDLISELLELSRIKTRRQKMGLVEIEALVKDLGGIFENDLKTRAISLVQDGKLPVLNGEKGRFRQIFQNLIDNAIKYMGDGPKREIHIGCALRAREAEFYVRDTGMGIDPEDIDRVFNIFRRGKNSAVLKISGKGVGLSSVKTIIETYKGQIRVESKLGEGTTFRFTINGQYVPDIQNKLDGAQTGLAV